MFLNMIMLTDIICYVHQFVYKHVLHMLLLVAFLRLEGKSLDSTKNMEFPVDTAATVSITYIG